jgi:hypothetical protein
MQKSAFFDARITNSLLKKQQKCAIIKIMENYTNKLKEKT